MVKVKLLFYNKQLKIYIFLILTIYGQSQTSLLQ